MALNPDTAARMVLFAQIGVVAAGALAVGAFLVNPFGAPDLDVTVTSRRPAARTEPAKPAPPAYAHTDWTTLAPAISWIAPDYEQPRIVGIEPEDEVDNDTPLVNFDKPQQSPPSEELGAIRYVGFLRERDQVVGLLSVEYRQRFVREGDAINEYTVSAVHPTHLILTKDLAEHRLDLVAAQQADLMQKLAPIPAARIPIPPVGGRADRDPRTPQGREAIERERRIREAAELAGERPS